MITANSYPAQTESLSAAQTSKLRVLMITEVLDPESFHLGFACEWVNALASCVERVYAAACFEYGYRSPKNVEVYPAHHQRKYAARGQGSWMRFIQIAGLCKQVWKCLFVKKVDAILVHMNPLFVLIAAPVAKLKNIPIVFWYARGDIRGYTPWAAALSTYIITASAQSCQIESPKRKVIGHGIDTNHFSPPATGVRPMEGRVILTVGRVVPIKRCDLILEAFGKLKKRSWFKETKLVFAGDVVFSLDHAYLTQLKERARQLGIEDRVEFKGQIPYADVAAVYQGCDLFVNATSPGSVDKAVLEAMACAKPIVVSNTAFREVLGDLAEELFVLDENVDDFARKMGAVLEMPRENCEKLGQALRQKVLEGHSLEGWARKTVRLMEEALTVSVA